MAVNNNNDDSSSKGESASSSSSSTLKRAIPGAAAAMGMPNNSSDCDRPACDDMVSKLKIMSASAASKMNAAMLSVNNNNNNNSADAKANSNNKAAKASSSMTDDAPCPPSSGQIGKGSWSLLHSMAAWYPDEPTRQDQQSITQFFDAFARFYPCTWCALDFQQNLKQKPVQASSRKELCQWTCEQHNLVNEKLGKALFSCDMKTLDDRWRKSNREKCKGGGH
mmetsp:Transcript_13196/g.17267  ORF Transcript_13196/g.17267 Transcript_13196/m.17267 type:complete len:223 (-) Transcript_13196:76-744(-)